MLLFVLTEWEVWSSYRRENVARITHSHRILLIQTDLERSFGFENVNTQRHDMFSIKFSTIPLSSWSILWTGQRITPCLAVWDSGTRLILHFREDSGQGYIHTPSLLGNSKTVTRVTSILVKAILLLPGTITMARFLIAMNVNPYINYSHYTLWTPNYWLRLWFLFCCCYILLFLKRFLAYPAFRYARGFSCRCCSVEDFTFQTPSRIRYYTFS